MFGNITVYDIITQAIGGLGMLAIFYSFQKNKNRQILGILIIGMSFFSIHFIMLGSYTGAALNILSVVRNGILLFRPRKWAQSKCWLYIFFAVYIAAGIITWESMISLVPMAGMIFGTLAVFAKETKNIRRFSLVCSVGWLIYNIYNLSIPGIITEISVEISIIIAMFKYDFKKLKSG